MKLTAILTALFVGWISNSVVYAAELAALTLPRVHVQPITATQSNKRYELYIKLPENYSEHPEKIYPVIYFTDALWHVEILSGATEFMMDEVILVGISWQKDIAEDLQQQYGAHASRYGDYSFKKITVAAHPKIEFGQADRHLAFIRDDVFKHVEGHYRTQPANRTYFGFSAGGGFGTYVLMAQPDTFKNYILGSPSVGNDASALFDLANPALSSHAAAINIFISYGELEKEASSRIDAFIREFKSKDYDGVSSLKHIVVESAGHSDSFPLMGVQSITWLANLQNQAGQ